MTNCEGKTVVRLDLWAILGFLVLLVGISLGYLFNAQADNRTERQGQYLVVNDRVTKLETNYPHILQGIADLKYGQEKQEKAQKELTEEIKKIRR